MEKLITFLRLSAEQKLLLLSAAIVLCGVWLGLRVIPFRVFHRLLLRGQQRAGGTIQVDATSADRIAWAVRLCARYLPARTCLAQAVATQVLLNRAGQKAHLRIGVVKGDGGQLQAHAWVESDGRILIGNLPSLSNFTVLSSPDQEPY
jgi:hypothetical protein